LLEIRNESTDLNRCFGISGAHLSFAEGDWGLGIGDRLWLTCILEQPQPIEPDYFKYTA
jgi:hypothetical protein